MIDRRVAWLSCIRCGADWPFPYPEAPGPREAVCHVCMHAVYSEVIRDLRAATIEQQEWEI